MSAPDAAPAIGDRYEWGDLGRADQEPLMRELAALAMHRSAERDGVRFSAIEFTACAEGDGVRYYASAAVVEILSR